MKMLGSIKGLLWRISLFSYKLLDSYGESLKLYITTHLIVVERFYFIYVKINFASNLLI
jgi:hypothetical protein